MAYLDSNQLQIFFQLFLAALLGGAIGFERKYVGRPAGMRTYALVCVGATLFTILSTQAFAKFTAQPNNFDPSRIASNVVVGIGFIGAGLIVLRMGRIEGLTTAAGLWLTAAIGMAVGVKFYLVSIFAALLAFFVISLFGWFEDVLISPREEKTQNEE